MGYLKRNHEAWRRTGRVVLGIFQAVGNKELTLDDIVPPFVDQQLSVEEKRQREHDRLMVIVKRREKAAAAALEKYEEKQQCESAFQNQT